MSDFDNKVKQVFNAMASSAAYSSSEPDQGHGSMGEWPPEGTYEVFITGLNVEPSEFRYGGGGIPGWMIQFDYECTEPLPEQAEPLKWKGAPFRIPEDPGQITEDGPKTRASIELRRLAGHVKTILKRNPSTALGDDLSEVNGLINSNDQALVAEVRCVYSERAGRTYRTEFLQRLCDA